MIHFLRRHDPEVKIDVVEIDSLVIQVAGRFFGVRSGSNLNILNQDGFVYLRTTDTRYDVIYLDAFLKPSPLTDATGVPLVLKTIHFYQEIQKKLTADGLVVFNLNPHDGLVTDLQNIRDGFPQVYVFPLPQDQGVIAVASIAQDRLDPAKLLAEGRRLDQRFQTSYSFQDMVRRLDK